MSNEELARTAAETPLEYEERLLTYLEKETAHSQKLSHSGDGTTETAMLGELTNAYTLERYGGKQTDDNQRTYLRTWVPGLIARLTGRASTRSTSFKRTDKRQAGEQTNT
jgi:hypothetical protein